MSLALSTLLFKLESRILHQSFSQDIDCLLADELREIGVDGAIHSRDEICQWLTAKDPQVRWDIRDFRIQVLAEELALTSYWAKQCAPVVSGSAGIMHSSLWVKNAKQEWQMRFHQATKVSPQ
jgi:hypothetical protein